MTWFDLVKNYYDSEIYTDQDVAGFVKTGQLTATDYQDITKKEYKEK